MDPNANLEEQRRIVARLIRDEKYPDEMSQAELQTYTENASRLVDLVEALDEWISKGGALPDAWRK